MAASKRLFHILVASFCLVLLAGPARPYTWGRHRPSFREPYGRYTNSQRGPIGSYGSYGNREGGYSSKGNHRRPVSVSPAPPGDAAPVGHDQEREGVVGIPPVPTSEGVVGIPPVPTSEGVSGFLRNEGVLLGAPPVATDGGKSHIHLIDGIEPPFLNEGFAGSDPSAGVPRVREVDVRDINLRSGP
ncbi:collagen alpha-1(IV) chain-like [Penaeus japonicus]|uniref:collagen alpha-1(IV) chain-like n=1 Tax=Penaeus japonicus TaxID=27405 RepID=UPI001C70FB15|nr:collagen alpha-1(IV) chain-like [Penaeus japonicus]